MRFSHSPITHLMLAMTLAIACVIPLQAVEQTTAQTDAEALTKQRTEMQAQQRQMHDYTRAQDVALAELVAKLNSAPADQQLATLIKVVTLISEQRTALTERREIMEKQMMHPTDREPMHNGQGPGVKKAVEPSERKNK